MLIIFEGADGAGKSTLVDAVVTQLRRHYPTDRVTALKRGPLSPRVHPLDEYQRPLDGYRPNSSEHIVCDRWHIGESVYPEVFGRPSKFERAIVRHTDAFLAARGALLVYVNPPYALNVSQLAQRGDDLVTTSQLSQIRSLFDQHVTQSQLNKYIVTDPRDTFQATRIIATARVSEESANGLRPFTTYVGPTHPLYLILGDVRHQLRRTPLADRRNIVRSVSVQAGPAFGPYPSTSGLYLLRHLPGSLWHASGGVGFANACDADDVAELIRTLSAYGNNPLRICALGHNAWSAIGGRLRDSLCVETLGAAPHPQFVRRFHHRDGFTYGAVVADALDFGKNLLKWRPTK